MDLRQPRGCPGGGRYVGVCHACVEQALSFVEYGDPRDVRMVDHRLPGGDGTQAIPQLRGPAPEVRFIVLTGSTGEQATARLRKSDMRYVPVFHAPIKNMTGLRGAIRLYVAGQPIGFADWWSRVTQ